MRYLKKFNEGQSPSDIIDSIEGILVGTFFSVKRDTIIDLPVTEVKIIFDK